MMEAGLIAPPMGLNIFTVAEWPRMCGRDYFQRRRAVSHLNIACGPDLDDISSNRAHSSQYDEPLIQVPRSFSWHCRPK